MKSALPLQSQEVCCLFHECLTEMGIRKTIPVYSTAFLKSPVTTGFINPRIFLPIHLISDFHPRNMRFILLHELQHCRQKDALTGHLINLASILYWFNPAVWYALAKMRTEREIACDAAVLQLLQKEDYIAYGNTLINFAERISLTPFPFAAGFGGNINQLQQRILHIAEYQPETHFRKIRGRVLCSLRYCCRFLDHL